MTSGDDTRILSGDPRDEPAIWSGFQLVTCFGLGYLRPASGTWGSLPPAFLAAVMILAGADARGWIYLSVIVGVLVLASGAVVLMGDRAEARWGKDPSNVVADEVAGMCIPLLLLPVAQMTTPGRTLIFIVAAFLLFRIFDVFKALAPPAESLQKIRGGWGILLDDLVSGLYALGGVWVIDLLAP
ncbi:MAG: phosphatidylglycerophosphatase A [Phycisphaerales bacterium]